MPALLWKVLLRNLNLNGNISEHQAYWQKINKMPFYAVAKGRSVGIYTSWAECEAQVKGYSGARYKKFDTMDTAANFVGNVGGYSAPSVPRSYNSYSSHYITPSTSDSTKRSLPSYHQETVAKKVKSQVYPAKNDNFSDDDDSEDLNTILTKQMDDIEKRLKGFEKGVDKIIKKGTKTKRKAILIDPPQKTYRGHNNFDVDNEGFVQVYTDGACSSNGRAGAKAGLGVYWGDEHTLNTSEPVSGRATNNCGEIQAATKAIKQALENGVTKLSINTDSKFLINSVTKWMPGWKRQGWKLKSGEPVKNEEDFKELDSVQHKMQVKWNYVQAHEGIHGNEKADQLAKAGAALYNN